MSLSRVTRIARGTPIATDRATGERLSRVTGLAVFASDALASVAYATEAILLILGLARGGGAPPLHGDLGCHRRADLVVSAYGPPIRAYPWGGGSAIVTRENLGRARRG